MRSAAQFAESVPSPLTDNAFRRCPKSGIQTAFAASNAATLCAERSWPRTTRSTVANVPNNSLVRESY